MNANEARVLTERNILSGANSYVKTISASIEEAVRNKKFSVSTYPENMSAEERLFVKDYFERLGYQYKFFSDQRDGSSITISW